MMRLACITLALGAALVGANESSSDASASASAAPARVIDRTFVCSTGIVAGGREIEIHARSGFRSLQNPTQWQMLPHAELRTRGPDLYLVSISAGAPREKNRNNPYDNGPFGSGLSVGAKSCKAARANISLSARSLSGGPASQLGEDYDCPAPWKVLVRVRAVFRAPTSLRLSTIYNWRAWRTSRTLRESPREAYFAVRTRRKPLAFAQAFESGKARLFTAPSCVAE